MAHVNWHILGHITREGKISVGGFSIGGEKLFDAPIDLEEMIKALAASHQIPPDLLLSTPGRKELTQLAVTLCEALTDVRDRLEEDKSKSELDYRRESDGEKKTP